ncbi:MAG: 2-C-methyl-D-erythritol 2,4-cyclodiphosphate synthase [Bacilli bacterium]
MIRIGNAIDIHKYVKDRKLVLGGVEIDFEYGLLGHSDADVVIHSVCEAIIGALGLGDLGKHFSDQDPKYKGIDSKLLLSEVVKLMEESSYEIGNIDITIVCEKPYLSEYKLLMKDNIGKIVKSNNVNIKATRGEGLGFVGRVEGVFSMCTLLLMKKER